jgi:iron complex transport system ATP-binding protein
MAMLTVTDGRFGYRRRTVLQGISLEIFKGQFLGIIGPNGSGKTTLLKAMSGLLKPKDGSLVLDGKALRSYRRDDLARRVALVPQSAVLPELFTALDIVMMGRMPHLGLLRYEGIRDIQAALESMQATHTAHLASRKMNELSGGERQRVIIARALAQEPTMLMLDEPTSNLDINYQAEILSFLRGLCRTGEMAVVATMHDINLASQYCDRIVMLHAGSIYRDGRPADVIETASIRDVFGADVMIYPHPANGLPTAMVAPQNHVRES